MVFADKQVVPTGAFRQSLDKLKGTMGAGETASFYPELKASLNWTGSTNSVSPQTSALGSGQALDITPSYYTVHMWLRLT